MSTNHLQPLHVTLSEITEPLAPLSTGPLLPDIATFVVEPKAAELDYRSLKHRLASEEPHYGFQDVRDLPELTLADLGIAIRAYPEYFIEALAQMGLGELLGQFWINSSALPADRVSDTTHRWLEATLRMYMAPKILEDIKAYCESHAQDQATDRDDRSRLSVSERAASDRGVSRLFR